MEGEEGGQPIPAGISYPLPMIFEHWLWILLLLLNASTYSMRVFSHKKIKVPGSLQKLFTCVRVCVC